MSDNTKLKTLIAVLRKRKEAGRPVQFWLRDDDATEPSQALDKFIILAEKYSIPATVAVIPAATGKALVPIVQGSALMSVAVHGWAHINHASEKEKKQELGLHRGTDIVVRELNDGFRQLQDVYADQFAPLLVPPWNRISDELCVLLPAIGFQALSTFGAKKFGPIKMINTHIDIIDWKGTRGGRAHDLLIDDVIDAVTHHDGPIGLLTHHLVHDRPAWKFMELFFDTTQQEDLCRWMSIHELMG